ncbi:polysaccharide pyruvyl transferase family protein [Rhodococcus aetherivorans]|uniref:polysaccharide pyruvyl transferase family protein n=1 Tax=Rhodococcus aetherivorans TaxID=191292 RepID=UPI003651EA68
MKPRIRARAVLRGVMRTTVFARFVLGIDRMVGVVALGLCRAAKGRPYEICIVSAPGDGNIGDQALLESALDRSAGARVIVFYSGSGEPLIPPRLKHNVDLAPGRSLVYSIGIRRWIAMARFVRRTRGVERTWVIGADTMDGAYNVLASISRFSIARIAGSLGSDARVLGFSWNNAPARSALLAAKMTEQRAHLLLRDPVSLERIRSQGISSARGSSDLVFARVGGDPLDHEAAAWVRERMARGRRIALVNASALLSGVVDQAPEYELIVASLLSCGWSVVFVPHVCRPGNSDLDELDRIRPCGGENDIFRVRDLLEPDQVASLASSASLVVTGRMHLAVLAILGSTYPITLASQGKVEGLYKYLGRADLCIRPAPGFGTEVVERISALDSGGWLNRRIPLQTVDELRSMARKSFNNSGQVSSRLRN